MHNFGQQKPCHSCIKMAHNWAITAHNSKCHLECALEDAQKADFLIFIGKKLSTWHSLVHTLRRSVFLEKERTCFYCNYLLPWGKTSRLLHRQEEVLTHGQLSQKLTLLSHCIEIAEIYVENFFCKF